MPAPTGVGRASWLACTPILPFSFSRHPDCVAASLASTESGLAPSGTSLGGRQFSLSLSARQPSTKVPDGAFRLAGWRGCAPTRNLHLGMLISPWGEISVRRPRHFAEFAGANRCSGGFGLNGLAPPASLAAPLCWAPSFLHFCRQSKHGIEVMTRRGAMMRTSCPRLLN